MVKGGVFIIERRNRYTINTDPQRRCYYGVHASTEDVWGPWTRFETPSPNTYEHALERKADWDDLSAYAARERKERVRSQHRIRCIKG